MSMQTFKTLTALSLALAALACGAETEAIVDDAPDLSNPILAIENEGEKEDTAYVNPAGKEVEVDLEADVVGGSFNVRKAPAELGQYAMTYLRKRGDFYLESLAESAGSLDRVEWRINGTWKTAAQAASAPASQLTHFRIRSVNAVLLNSAATGVRVGKTFTATVPRDPFNVMRDARDSCADKDDHMSLSANIYWYMWNPSLRTCKLPTQEMAISVSKVLPKGNTVYPEYDKLFADNKLTAVILFGQIGDGAITDRDPGMYAYNLVASQLTGARYTEVKPAPVGRRFTKKFGTVDVTIDLYSPRDFAGLGDYAHIPNLQKAINEHEIVAYDGHSMLGASDSWSKRVTYPRTYQIFLYGGCLGYEYYVRPIVEAKGGWANLDMMTSVLEVTANGSEFAMPAIAKMTWAITHGNRVSWQSLLSTVRTSTGDESFGASGVRDNRYKP
jgi:hypothetical protein